MYRILRSYLPRPKRVLGFISCASKWIILSFVTSFTKQLTYFRQKLLKTAVKMVIFSDCSVVTMNLSSNDDIGSPNIPRSCTAQRGRKATASVYMMSRFTASISGMII